MNQRRALPFFVVTLLFAMAAPVHAASPGDKGFDPCTLLSAADAKALLGAVKTKSWRDDKQPWTGACEYESVTPGSGIAGSGLTLTAFDARKFDVFKDVMLKKQYENKEPVTVRGIGAKAFIPGKEEGIVGTMLMQPAGKPYGVLIKAQAPFGSDAAALARKVAQKIK